MSAPHPKRSDASTYFRKGFGLKSEVQDDLAADYVIPSPFDERVAPAVTAAVAAAARAEGVARR